MNKDDALVTTAEGHRPVGRASPERVLSFIEAFVAENEGSGPRVKDIAANFGVTSPAVDKHLKALERQGKILRVREKGLGFSIYLLSPAGTLATVSVPIRIEGYFMRQGLVRSFSDPATVPLTVETVHVLDAGNVFGLLAGEDNPDYYIQRGDLLVFERDRPPRPSQLVAFECNGELTLLMHYLAITGVSPREVNPPEALAMEAIAAVPLAKLGELQGSTGMFVTLANAGQDFDELREFLEEQKRTQGALRLVGPAIKLSRTRLQLLIADRPDIQPEPLPTERTTQDAQT